MQDGLAASERRETAARELQAEELKRARDDAEERSARAEEELRRVQEGFTAELKAKAGAHYCHCLPTPTDDHRFGRRSGGADDSVRYTVQGKAWRMKRGRGSTARIGGDGG